MQSQGSTSSQPSFNNSLSSSDSLLLSDSDQVEDDTDVFLTDGSSSSSSSSSSSRGAVANGGSESPGSQWTCDGFTDKEDEEEAERGRKGPGGGDRTQDKTPKSHGDVLFAQKCAELQGFVRPLLELLSGLKRGRFERGLSGFQQSVAMDRIQRIVGVLQKPNSGEKYLNTLLQVEMMLKLWFPQIPTTQRGPAPPSGGASSPARLLQDSSSSSSSSSIVPTPPHKHRDQLHIPVKKRRLSWTGADTPTPSPALPKCPHITAEAKRPKRDHGQTEESPAPLPPPAPLTPPPSSAPSANQSPEGAACEIPPPTEDTKGSDEERAALKSGSEPGLTRVHVAPVPSPSGGEDQPVGGAAAPLLASRGSPAMQDCAISSTTLAKEQPPTRCQSQSSVAGQQSDTDATPEGQSQAPPTACPAPLET